MGVDPRQAFADRVYYGWFVAAASLSFAVSGLRAPPVVGNVFETLGSYTVGLVVAGIGGLIGAECVAFASRLV